MQLKCAINASRGHNSPSTFSHFCNPEDAFRASVICGQSIDLLRRVIISRDFRLLTTNQKAGSSNLSGRAINIFPLVKSSNGLKRQSFSGLKILVSGWLLMPVYASCSVVACIQIRPREVAHKDSSVST